MVGVTALSAFGFNFTNINSLDRKRLSNDLLDRALNWKLWATGAVAGSLVYASSVHHLEGIQFLSSVGAVFHGTHLTAAQIGSFYLIYVIKNVLPTLTKNVTPLVSRVMYGCIGTAITAAVSMAATRMFHHSFYSPHVLLIQAIVSVAAGVLYSQLGESGYRGVVQDYLFNKADLHPFPPAPDWVREEVAKDPEWFGKMLGEKKYPQVVKTRRRLPSILEGLGLKGEARTKFGLAFAQAADREYRHLAETRVHPMVHFNLIVAAGKAKVLEGNLIIEALRRALSFNGSHSERAIGSPVNTPTPTLDCLGGDVVRSLCLFLEPLDIDHLAAVSRRLHYAVGFREATIWQGMKLSLLRELTENQGEPKLLQFRDAVLLAWPDFMLHNLSEIEDLREGVAILQEEIPPNDKFAKFLLLFGRDNCTRANYVLMARLLRNHPEIFKTHTFWISCFVTKAQFLWDPLDQFGLPYEALQPFCEGVRSHLNIITNRTIVKDILMTARRDYPYFDFEPLLPIEL